MMNNENGLSGGKQLIFELRNHEIVKDLLGNHGYEFHGGYEELYADKFKDYLGSVSRHIRNSHIIEECYYGF